MNWFSSHPSHPDIRRPDHTAARFNLRARIRRLPLRSLRFRVGPELDPIGSVCFLSSRSADSSRRPDQARLGHDYDRMLCKFLASSTPEMRKITHGEAALAPIQSSKDQGVCHRRPLLQLALLFHPKEGLSFVESLRLTFMRLRPIFKY